MTRLIASSLVWALLVLTLMGNARAATEKVLYAFQEGKDGGVPIAGLISDRAGNLYGTTLFGGDLNCGVRSGCGTVFELRHTKNGWQEDVVYSFAGGSDGATPYAGLTMDRKGLLYGTTVSGGGNGCRGLGCGVVFKLTRTSAGTWRETVLRRFSKFEDGQNPQGRVILDPHGNLYGTTYGGGGSRQYCDAGCGVVFQLTPNGSGEWPEHVLYHPVSNGNFIGGLIFDRAGNLYGTTWGCDGCGGGEMFMLANDKGTWTASVLYYFGGAGGIGSYAGLILDKSGNLYGTSPFGGVNNNCFNPCGAVFELAHNSGGQWSDNILYSFNGGLDGAQPEGPVKFGHDGSLYGTTEWGGGGVECQLGCGTVFKLTPSGEGWSETVLHRFQAGLDGFSPYSGVTLHRDGKIYGTTAGGGAYGGGTVYEITP